MYCGAKFQSSICKIKNCFCCSEVLIESFETERVGTKC